MCAGVTLILAYRFSFSFLGMISKHSSSREHRAGRESYLRYVSLSMVTSATCATTVPNGHRQSFTAVKITEVHG